MNSKEYIVNVKKTESCDTDKILGRLSGKSSIRLLHSAMGIVTEVAEIYEAIDNGDLVNLKEELGDCLWYLAISIDILKIDTNLLYTSTQPHYNIGYLASEYLDVIKKYIFYGKEYSLTATKVNVLMILGCIFNICNQYSISVNGMMDDNIEKLKKRYGDKFSEEKAINRDIKKELDHF